MERHQTPVAGRLRRPGWSDPKLLIGLALIVGSILAVTAIVSGADRTDARYAAREALPAGSVITEDSVVIVHVRVGDGYIAHSEAPWGMVTTRGIGPGELIPAAALTDADDFVARPVAVSVTVPLAPGIEPGSIVDVWVTSDEDPPESTLVAEGVAVEAIEHAGGGLSGARREVVYVIVPAADVGEVLAALARDGDVAVVGIAGVG